MLASDLYLLEKWSSLGGDPNERRSQIFHEYVRIGTTGRWPYHEAIKSGSYQQPAQTQSISILDQVRTAHEREVASILVCGQLPPRRVWLRTSYEEVAKLRGTNPLEALNTQDIGEATGQDDSRVLVLDQEARYKHADWSQILYYLPEILDSYRGPRSPDQLRGDMQAAKEEVEPELENEEDEEAQEEITGSIQQAWVTGILWVQDEKTANTGEVLLLWLDEFGRVVREARVEIDKITEWTGMFFKCADAETEWWRTADVGETYEGGAWPA